MRQSDTFFDRQFQQSTQRILPGDFEVARLGTNQGLLMTVLGSCVSVCLRDVVNGVAGLNHFMLPEAGISSEIGPQQVASLNARYGAHAMELLINKMLSMGAKKRNLQAYIFGGAAVLKRMTDIGKDNITFALTYLNHERISLVASDVGGTSPKKVYLNLDSGLPVAFNIDSALTDVKASEELYGNRLLDSVKRQRSSVSLFE